MLTLLPTVCGTFIYLFYLIAKRTELDSSFCPLVFWFLHFQHVNDNRQACLLKPLVSTQDVQILMGTLTAPYKPLAGIKSINLKDVLRSLEILMQSK